MSVSTATTMKMPERPRSYVRTPQTVGSFAGFLGVSERSVWRLIERGDLAAVRVSSRAVRILPADANEFLRSRLIPRCTPESLQ